MRSNAESGDGYSDIMIEIEAQEIGIVIELKYAENAAFDTGCREALRQIREKKYASWVENYTGEILLVGISYDEEKGHDCVIEKHIL